MNSPRVGWLAILEADVSTTLELGDSVMYEALSRLTYAFHGIDKEYFEADNMRSNNIFT